MTPTSNDSISRLFFQVIRLHYQRNQMLLDTVGLYPGQPPLLVALSRVDGWKQKELANLLHIKAATLTVMLGRMEKSGFIERRQDPNDQRISRVYLTDKGRDVCVKMQEVMQTLRDECFQHFSPEDTLTMQRLFGQMRDNLAQAVGLERPFKTDGCNGQE
ncbi:MarR family winged helix-turn-helix transcriptional regulator [Gorillibacterium massiliense]|uniref:MarR family winged helix-turn-helix transcriptional regulator n=1 Tax=Gorillibacterium massiliense TaxID=1280390 RepID=UPI0004B490F0|nr:MarR family transcriptional regulator [Gorillibacterium massiliense]